jgi:hypothetical protein
VLNTSIVEAAIGNVQMLQTALGKVQKGFEAVCRLLIWKKISHARAEKN